MHKVLAVALSFVFLAFGAVWCPVCRRMEEVTLLEPSMQALASVVSEQIGGAVLYRVRGAFSVQYGTVRCTVEGTQEKSKNVCRGDQRKYTSPIWTSRV